MWVPALASALVHPAPKPGSCKPSHFAACVQVDVNAARRSDTMNNPHIRPARVEDAAVIAAGEHEVARAPGLLIARPGEIPESAFRKTIAALAAGSDGRYLVAERDGEVVGHLLLEPLALAARAHVCTLTVVVYPGCQGQGIGRALLAKALDWARSHPRIKKIELTVRADNARALDLYRTFGFVQEGLLRRRVQGSDGVCRVDIAMALFVD